MSSLLWVTVALLCKTTGMVAWQVEGIPRLKNFSFVQEPDNMVVSQGQNVQLPCKGLFDDNIPAAISWKHNGQPLSSHSLSASQHFMLENGSLFIMNFSESDTGLYSCVAEMTGDHRSSNSRIATPEVRLQLAGMPTEFDHEAEGLHLELGDTAMFMCRVRSRPAATYTWWKEESDTKLTRVPGGRAASSGNGSCSSHTMVYPDDGVLEICSLQASDFGVYRCIASSVQANNDLVSAPVQLVRLHSPTGVTSFSHVKFVMRPWDTDVIEGASVILFCGANDRTEDRKLPAISWLKGGSLVNTASSRHISILGNGNLLINNATEEDSGQYTCAATSSTETMHAYARLRVLVPPRLIKKPESHVVHEDADTKLKCLADGVPKPRIYWLKNTEVVLPTNVLSIVPDDGLHITGALQQHSGFYQCIAENDVGRAHAVAYLAVLENQSPDSNSMRSSSTSTHGGLPAPPAGLAAKATTTQSVSLKWEPPSPARSTAVSGYRLTVKELVTNVRQLRNATTIRTEHTWSRLKPGTLYEFGVFAQDFAGRLSNAVILQASTLPLPETPAWLQVSALSTKAIRVTWAATQSPSNDQALLTYLVQYYYRFKPFVIKSVSTSLTSVVLKGLTPFTDYYVRVSANNSISHSKPTGWISVRTLSAMPGVVPQNVTVVATGSSTILVQWQPPPNDSFIRNITGYEIRYKARQGVVLYVIIRASEGSWELTDLESGELYFVKIAVISMRGRGDFTSWQKATTNYTYPDTAPPSEPQILRHSVFATKIRIRWDPPVGHEAVLGYCIGYGKTNDSERQDNVDANQRKYTLRKLSPATCYRIKLWAYNGAGQGRFVTKQACTLDSSIHSRRSSSGRSSNGFSSMEPNNELSQTTETQPIAKSTRPAPTRQGHDGSPISYSYGTDNGSLALKRMEETGNDAGSLGTPGDHVTTGYSSKSLSGVTTSMPVVMLDTISILLICFVGIMFLALLTLTGVLLWYHHLLCPKLKIWSGRISLRQASKSKLTTSNPDELPAAKVAAHPDVETELRTPMPDPNMSRALEESKRSPMDMEACELPYQQPHRHPQATTSTSMGSRMHPLSSFRVPSPPQLVPRGTFVRQPKESCDQPYQQQHRHQQATNRTSTDSRKHQPFSSFQAPSPPPLQPPCTLVPPPKPHLLGTCNLCAPKLNRENFLDGMEATWSNGTQCVTHGYKS